MQKLTVIKRFGFKYIQTRLGELGKRIEVVQMSKDDKQELLQDFISIIYSFSARLYGLRRAKEKVDKIKQEVLTDV